MRRRGVWLGLLLLALVTAALVGMALSRVPTSSANASGTRGGIPATTGTTTQASGRSGQDPTGPSGSPSGGSGTLVVLGDGYAARAPWVGELAQRLDMKLTDLAEDGMGYRVAPTTCDNPPCHTFGGLAPRVAKAQPDIVLVIGGDADGDYDLTPFVTTTLRALKDAVPQAEIVTTTPLSSRSPRPYWLTLHAQAIERVSTEAGARWISVRTIAADPASYDGTALTTSAGDALAGYLAGELK